MNKKGISIGEDKYIQWEDLPPIHKELNIDFSIYEMNEFWKNLETECVAGCCGIDAFRFWPEDISRATSAVNKNELVENLFRLEREVGESDKQIIISYLLNAVFTKKTFLELIEHIFSCVIEC